MELIMQELLNAGIITMEQVERARMEKIMKALEEYGIETPKITKRRMREKMARRDLQIHYR